jgi:hypothetical protein
MRTLLSLRRGSHGCNRDENSILSRGEGRPHRELWSSETRPLAFEGNRSQQVRRVSAVEGLSFETATLVARGHFCVRAGRLCVESPRISASALAFRHMSAIRVSDGDRGDSDVGTSEGSRTETFADASSFQFGATFERANLTFA